MLPLTNTREDIEAVVRFAKYAPIGERGVSTTRAHTLYSPPPLSVYMQEANAHMRVYAQLETKEAIENAEEILSVDGVDGAFVGPNDLSVSLGCVGRKEPIYECLARVAAAASAVGKSWGIITADRDLIACAKRHSVDMISAGSELNMLINGCKKVKNDIE